jgi:hypothetical protein
MVRFPTGAFPPRVWQLSDRRPAIFLWAQTLGSHSEARGEDKGLLDFVAPLSHGRFLAFAAFVHTVGALSWESSTQGFVSLRPAKLRRVPSCQVKEEPKHMGNSSTRESLLRMELHADPEKNLGK